MNSFNSSNHNDIHLLKEQLRLFAFNTTPQPERKIQIQFDKELTLRDRLEVLLEGELNFHGENSAYASHTFHAFAAKFPPQLPRAFIRGLTNQGEIVLDPMMGSGTTVVEALIENRIGIGLDLDPLAIRLSQVKTSPIEINALRRAGEEVILKALSSIREGDKINNFLETRFDEKTKSYIDFWFKLKTQEELAALVLAIGDIEDYKIRRFLELNFSSIIVTKSGGVSLARDLAHSRPHLDKEKVPKNAVEQFSVRFRKNLSSIAQLHKTNHSITTISGDARIMPFKDKTIDLIITSPPYANAIDYMRAHKFSLVWFGDSVDELAKLRSMYIGSERIGNSNYAALPNKTESLIRQLNVLDKKKAAILRKYFSEMKSAISEMYRILKNDAACIIVVGTSTMRGINVETHSCIADISADIGFEVVGVVKRILDRNKRIMPARFGKKSDSLIEQRMHEEYVIGLLKQAS